MPTAFLFHGIEGNPKENWLPWLKKELTAKGYDVIIPHFPGGSEPALAQWEKVFTEYTSSIDSASIIIAHSLGCAFALRVLENLTHPIFGTILVAPVWGRGMGQEYEPAMENFVRDPFDWDVIKNNGGAIQIIQSDNDRFIPLRKSSTLSHHLHCPLAIIHDAGHFNTSSGYDQFPELLELLDGGIR
ncbi:MAG: alpha/beta fold hydrolase [Candidatus Peregrinibacteria bacterium]